MNNGEVSLLTTVPIDHITAKYHLHLCKWFTIKKQKKMTKNFYNFLMEGKLITVEEAERRANEILKELQESKK